MPPIQRIWLIAGAINGLIAVAVGAFGAHGAKDWPERYVNALKTGAQYEMYHALALLAVALLPRTTATSTAGWCFLAGLGVFSGSLYLLAIFRMNAFGAITPIGGVLLLVGWGALVVWGVAAK
jgi:uncharacterized membrane protein YgdD (TMEM256/DUF423 family)